ncbi:unnamed protein product, partial [Owenia fusiformis]
QSSGKHLNMNYYGCVYLGCEWSRWSRWIPSNGGRCPVTCGGGIIPVYRTRTKMFSTGGRSPVCRGESEQRKTERCNPQGCRTCSWANWEPWIAGFCSVTCGSGSEIRTRLRNKVWSTNQQGSSDCFGNPTERTVVECTRGPCTGCRWSDWSQWDNGPCTLPCGGGTSTSTRRRTKQLNVIGGALTCPGSDFEMRTSPCNTNQCCQWSMWGSWLRREGCSVTCGGGNINVYRTRTKTFGTVGSSPFCTGVSEERSTERCNIQGCRTCLWSNWGQWVPGLCSVTCGSGTMTQTRTRNKRWGTDPEGSPVCLGSATATTVVSCKMASCTGCGIWEPWGPWICQQDLGLGKRTGITGGMQGGCRIPGRLVRTRICPICPVGRSVDDEHNDRRKRHGLGFCGGVSIERGAACCVL